MCGAVKCGNLDLKPRHGRFLLFFVFFFHYGPRHVLEGIVIAASVSIIRWRPPNAELIVRDLHADWSSDKLARCLLACAQYTVSSTVRRSLYRELGNHS